MNAPINSPLLSLWEDVIDVLTLYPLEDPSSKQICQDLTKSLQLDKGKIVESGIKHQKTNQPTIRANLNVDDEDDDRKCDLHSSDRH
jgi:hypothetical protein